MKKQKSTKQNSTKMTKTKITAQPNDNYYEGRGNLKVETESLRVFEPTIKETYLSDLAEKKGYEVCLGKDKEGKDIKVKLMGFGQVISKTTNKPILLLKIDGETKTIKYYCITDEGNLVLKLLLAQLNRENEEYNLMNMKDNFTNVLNAVKFEEKRENKEKKDE
jgi:hypothetical protein